MAANCLNYTEQGGSASHIGGALTVASGGTLTVAGTQAMSGTLNMSGTQNISGLLKFTGAAQTNAIDFSGHTVDATKTNGSLITTGSTWINFTAANQTGMKLLLSSSATSGDFATIRMRARADAAGNVVTGNFAASAGVNNYGDLYALQGYAQPLTYTQSGASNIVCGVYSCIDKASGATSGRHWSTWTDEHSNVVASGGHYMHRLSNNSTNSSVYNGCWTVYPGAGMTYLFNLENANAPVASGDKTGGSKTHALAVNINGTPAYIQCYDA